ncbi:hypothetical protein HanIR_Chr07g0334081 [Helianthus annuus]|nr:hypothetical protein HanIR_Chr07g0334081 [Helianthus annuus]
MLFVRGIGLFVAALVLIWNTRYRGGLAIISDDKTLIFNIGCGYINALHHNALSTIAAEGALKALKNRFLGVLDVF